MTYEIAISITRKHPLDGGDRYPQSDTLANLSIEVGERLGWQVYADALRAVTLDTMDVEDPTPGEES